MTDAIHLVLVEFDILSLIVRYTKKVKRCFSYLNILKIASKLLILFNRFKFEPIIIYFKLDPSLKPEGPYIIYYTFQIQIYHQLLTLS